MLFVDGYFVICEFRNIIGYNQLKIERTQQKSIRYESSSLRKWHLDDSKLSWVIFRNIRQLSTRKLPHTTKKMIDSQSTLRRLKVITVGSMLVVFIFSEYKPKNWTRCSAINWTQLPNWGWFDYFVWKIITSNLSAAIWDVPFFSP